LTYPETIEYLYSMLPVFHRIGEAAYKPGLETTLQLLEAIGNPHLKFKSIHIAGTNGKGSSSHSLASILQEAGYKTGLYTSPHLFDFRERIRLNGKMIAEQEVVEKVEAWKGLVEELKPSFFELTVALAFDFFAREQVDIAVIEVGMGGRLDSTNVITPELSLITNISYDHQKFLGDTLPQIASEKAGIIKPGIPVIISETQAETQAVFRQKAEEEKARIHFAEDWFSMEDAGHENGRKKVKVKDLRRNTEAEYRLSLGGNYQQKNLGGILASVEMLRNLGWKIPETALFSGLEKVKENTGLRGRWDVLQKEPLVICDTAHNEDGVREAMAQMASIRMGQHWLIWGMVNDKDHRKVISLLPRNARYIACQPDIPRALPATEMNVLLLENGLESTMISKVEEALSYCLEHAAKEDVIYVGGSTFTVASLPEKFFSEGN
jgi:dihydrofolate synthase/folylpolyglutamate synthase